MVFNIGDAGVDVGDANDIGCGIDVGDVGLYVDSDIGGDDSNITITTNIRINRCWCCWLWCS